MWTSKGGVVTPFNTKEIMSTFIFIMKVIIGSPFMIVTINKKRHPHYYSVKLFLWIATLSPLIYYIVR